jgi:hypothetical protein
MPAIIPSECACIKQLMFQTAGLQLIQRLPDIQDPNGPKRKERCLLGRESVYSGR